jgi:hypothetical protein
MVHCRELGAVGPAARSESAQERARRADLTFDAPSLSLSL